MRAWFLEPPHTSQVREEKATHTMNFSTDIGTPLPPAKREALGPFGGGRFGGRLSLPRSVPYPCPPRLPRWGDWRRSHYRMRHAASYVNLQPVHAGHGAFLTCVCRGPLSKADLSQLPKNSDLIMHLKIAQRSHNRSSRHLKTPRFRRLSRALQPYGRTVALLSIAPPASNR